MNLPAAAVSLATAAFGAVLYGAVPGMREVGVVYWAIAGYALVQARMTRSRGRHRARGRKRSGRTRREP